MDSISLKKIQKEMDVLMMDIFRMNQYYSGFFSGMSNRRCGYTLKCVLQLECDAGAMIVSVAGLNIPGDIWQKMQPHQEPIDHVAAHEGDRRFLEWLRVSGQKVRVLEGNRERIESSEWADVLIF